MKPTYKLEDCGVPNFSWHFLCIERALAHKYGEKGFVWKRQHPHILKKRNLKHLGRFCVFGELDRWFMPSEENRQCGLYVDCTGPTMKIYIPPGPLRNHKNRWLKDGIVLCWPLSRYRVFRLQINQ